MFSKWKDKRGIFYWGREGEKENKGESEFVCVSRDRDRNKAERKKVDAKYYKLLRNVKGERRNFEDILEISVHRKEM